MAERHACEKAGTLKLYTYSLSIRIWHPSIDPDEITRVLGITPNRALRAGQPRMTPKGDRLPGVYRESYWWADPFAIRGYFSIDRPAAETVTKVVDLLEPHTAFLRRLRAEGATIRLWIDTYGKENYALEVSPDLMGRCAALGASLVHDVYQVPQNRWYGSSWNAPTGT